MHKRSMLFSRTVLLLGVLFLALAGKSFAAVKTWDGGGSGNTWTEPGNWDNDTPPQFGDDLVFPAVAAKKNATNDFPSGTTFNSITFTGDGYTLNGNRINLAGDVNTNANAGTANLINFDIFLPNGDHFFNTAANTTLTIGNTAGSIAGPGTVVKIGTGTLTLAGDVANTFTGGTFVDDGVLQLNNNGIDTAIPGSLVIGDGVGALQSAVVRLQQFSEIANNAPVTVNSDGLLNLNSNSETFGSLTVNGSGDLANNGLNANSNVTLGGAFLTLSTPITGSNNVLVLSNSATIGLVPPNGIANPPIPGPLPNGEGTIQLNGDVVTSDPAGLKPRVFSNLDLEGATRTLTINSFSPTSAEDADFFGTISTAFGTAGITKVGAGVLALGSPINTGVPANSYNGPTNINAGGIIAATNGALGSTASGTTVATGAALSFFGVNYTTPEPVTINGNGFVGPIAGNQPTGAIVAATTANLANPGFVFTGPITLGSDSQINNFTLGATPNYFGANFVGPINLNGHALTLIDRNTALTNIAGQITGGGSVTSAGEGAGSVLKLSSGTANNYTGATIVAGSTLQLASTASNGAVPGALVIGSGTGAANSSVVQLLAANQIGDAALVGVNKDGQLNFNNFAEAIGGLSITDGNATTGTNNAGAVSAVGLSLTGGSLATPGSGTFTTGDVAATSDAVTGTATIGNLNLNGANRTFTVADGPADIDALVTGVISNGGLTKTGAGVLQLDGTSTYTGSTSLTAGTLEVTGDISSSPISVSGGLLAGDGSIGNLTTTGGTVSPGTLGASAVYGILDAGTTALNSGTTFAVQLGGVNTSTVTNSDQLAVTGTVNLGGATLNTILNYAPTATDAITIIDNDGTDAVVGTFAGLPEGALVPLTFNGKTYNFRISYRGGVNNNDVVLAVVPTISIGDVSAVEGNSGNTVFNFPVTLSQASSVQVSVNFATADGTATIGDNDYGAASGTITFTPGQTTKNISINVKGDTKSELNETFFVNLTAATNGTSAPIARAQATGTIINDDPVAMSINDVSINEGNSGTTNAVFTVSLANALSQTVTVNYATASGTAVAGSDFTAVNGTLTFNPGEVSKTISVPIIGDTTNEANETFTVTLSTPANATLARAIGTGTIVNDDAVPGISVNSVTVNAGNVGTSTQANFTISLSAPSGQTVTVAYATADGTAKAGVDYGATSGTITFTPGQTTKTVAVPVAGNNSGVAKSFFLNLSNATNATLNTPQGVGTILGNGAPTPVPTPVVNVAFTNIATGNLFQAFPTLYGSVTITNPAPGTSLSVVVAVQRSDGQYFTGTGYSVQPVFFPAPLINGNFDVPAGLLPTGQFLKDGRYTVTAIATDGAGHTKSSVVTLFIDHTPPTVSITTPRPQSAVGKLLVIGGIATDPTDDPTATKGLGVKQVLLFIKAISGPNKGRYFNGTQFVTPPANAKTQPIALNTNYDPGKGVFARRSGLPTQPGEYLVTAIAVDIASNRTETQSTFTIKSSTPPVAASVGVSTATASVVSSSAKLRFLGALAADSASDAAHYVVEVNGHAVTVESASYDDSTHSVVLGLAAGALQNGDHVVVKWNGLQDAKGQSVDGQTSVLTAK